MGENRPKIVVQIKCQHALICPTQLPVHEESLSTIVLPAELDIFNFLAEVRLFHGLSNEQKSLFLPYLYLRQYKQDEVVFFRGDPAHALYVIKQGTIELVLDVDQVFEKLAVLTDKQTFGNNALIEGTKRLYSAVVQSDEAELYVIPTSTSMTFFGISVRCKPRCSGRSLKCTKST